jgi:hypothetical protein
MKWGIFVGNIYPFYRTPAAAILSERYWKVSKKFLSGKNILIKLKQVCEKNK